MSLARAIDSAVRCTICKTPGVGTCSCLVTLRCPRCKRTQIARRMKGDGDAREVELRCPDCADVEGAVE